MITVVGSNTVDYFCYSSRLPMPGETLYGSEMLIGAGGKGANQAAAAAKLGAETHYLSIVGGMDKYVGTVLDGIKNAGVDISGVETEPGVYCGAGFVMINTETAQNSIIILRGANAYITPEYVDRHKDLILKADICMTEFMIPLETSKYVMSLAHKSGVTAILNPAPAFAMDDDFYKVVDIITPNEVEAKGLCGIEVTDRRSAAEAADFFHGKGVPNVVITLGSRGSFVSSGGRQEMVEAYKVCAVDSSGAGDCFGGALACALQSGKDIFEAARFANAASAVSVTKKGTMDSMPTLAEVRAQLARGL